MALVRLSGNELIAHKKTLENKGFTDVVKDVVGKLLKENDTVTYHEVRFLLEKLKDN